MKRLCEPASRIHPRLLFVSWLTLAAIGPAAAVEVGVARIEVTPAEPIRLTGYAMRQTNSVGVEQKLWAKALAIGSDREGPAVLLTLDNCGIAEETYQELVRRLAKSARLKQARLAIGCSHTHSAPATAHWAPNIFVKDLPADQQAAIDRYTAELIGKLEQAALAALKDRRPGKLSWSQGSVDFARNRRVVRGNTAQFGDNNAGPVDHALPMLKFEDAQGKIRAVLANYACHCTTLGGEFNHVCGDWAGYAQEYIERDQPGAVALITIGCGADANPAPRGGTDGGLALAKQHGGEIAAEVKRLLAHSFIPLKGKLTTRLKEVELPFAPHFTREQWEERAKQSGIIGYHAKKQLARLDRGEKLATRLYYPVSTWAFGDDLAMVFLPGEVVVDYALRLKEEFDPARLWVTAYANYVPCYIPSRRILAEGGYEAEESLWYYDRPARISTNAEEIIVKTVREVVPKAFQQDRKKAELPDPKTPQQALGSFRTRADLTVELVASEPLIESPVAIDWGADGRLWVCEMYDYPSGVDGRGKPGGRIKVLTDTNGDGRYDQAALFLNGLAFPTGVMPWRQGALICAAPDILYAEDTNGDGKADVVRTNFTGFATHNFQARVNGFTWGLDGWLHGSSGLFGGKIKSLLTGKTVDLSGRDFRIKPDTGEIEAVSGLSQMGRIRDDFGNWFGNDNSTLLWHYPLEDRYLRRNPHVTYPEPRASVAREADANKLFPAGRTLERFNDLQAANRVTSACGPCLYRDNLLGAEYSGNAFICEPVHNLVRRMVVEPDGVTFAGRRAPDEQRGEFLASTDNWFRPVQARTGPDGALWVVDMYRFVVEHPRWIPPERLKHLDPRAGADRGRIYRVYPQSTKPRVLARMDQFTPTQLASAVGAVNGVVRDLAHRELCELRERGLLKPMGRAAAPEEVLADIAEKNPSPAARVQALAALAGWRQLSPALAERSLTDPDARVRREALRRAEPLLASGEVTSALQAALARLVEDSSPAVRLQTALSLGEWNHPGAAALLAKLAGAKDRWLQAAVLSSAGPWATNLLGAAIALAPTHPNRDSFVRQLMSSAVAQDPYAALNLIIASCPGSGADERYFHDAASYYDALDIHRIDLNTLGDVVSVPISAATTSAGNESAPAGERLAAIPLLGRGGFHRTNSLALLRRFLTVETSGNFRRAALENLRRQKDPEVAALLLTDWAVHPPSVRAGLIDILLTREGWTLDLLKAIDQGSVSRNEIPIPSRQVLLRHKNTSLRDRAATLLAGPQSSSRAEVVGRYQGVLALTGVPDRGIAAFDKNCAQCHAFRSHGHAVGPNLGEFAGKSVADFVTAIFDPNAAINPNYVAYNVETKDGRSLSGVVRGETASGLTLVQGGGAHETILRSDVQEIRASQLSLMPEGLEQAMSPQDVADLIAWIKGSGPAAFGSATPGQAGKAREQFFATGVNGVSKIIAAGGQLPYSSWIGRWPMGFCRQDEGMNRVTWQTAPVPKNLAPDAAWSFRLPVGMGFLSQPAGKFTLRLNGQPKIEFDVSLADRTWQSVDGEVRMTYTVMEANNEDSNGVLVIETAGKLLKPGEPATWEVVGSGARSQRWFGVYLVAN